MPIYKPSELRQFLYELGISPKKALSQNFLIDGNIVRKIVSEAEVQPGDIIVEIGPGPGCLTETLLDAGAKVFAIEKDRTLAQALDRLKKPENHLEVFCEDIMEFPLEKMLSERLPAGAKAKVIANLPYHLTTPIITHLVELRSVLSHLILMVQDEVALRFTAKPSTKDYSSITVFLHYYCLPKYLFRVSRNCFFPAPRVDSAIVSLQLAPPPLPVMHEEKFFQLTRECFAHRRKMLTSSLKKLYDASSIVKALKELHLSPNARPEELSLPQFISLFEKINNINE